MFAKSILVGSLLLAAVSAQSNSDSSSVQGPDGNLVSVQVVQVSDMNATLKFYPEEIQAEAGSMVQFQFYPKNHTITQSTFANPCVPINSVMSNVTGINSGPMPPENGMMKVFTIMVNDTKPLWMYCATGDHCQKGMVMAINAPSEGDKTLALYKSMASRVASNSSSANGTNATTGDAATANPDPNAASALNTMVGATSVGAFLVAAFVLFF